MSKIFFYSLINEGTSEMLELAQRAFKKLGIYRKGQDKIAGLIQN